jgi:hypothetical protein
LQYNNLYTIILLLFGGLRLTREKRSPIGWKNSNIKG